MHERARKTYSFDYRLLHDRNVSEPAIPKHMPLRLKPFFFTVAYDAVQYEHAMIKQPTSSEKWPSEELKEKINIGEQKLTTS